MGPLAFGSVLVDAGHDLSLDVYHPSTTGPCSRSLPLLPHPPPSLPAVDCTYESSASTHLLSPASWALRHTSPMPRPPTSSPPPAGFSFATGSFDFPHASTSPPNTGRSNLGNVLRLADEPPERSPAHLDRLIEARRRPNRRRLYRLPGPPRDSDDGTYESNRRPLPAYSSRPQATPSERYLQRAQARIDEERDALLTSNVEPFDSLSERPPVITDFEDWVNMTNRQSSPGVSDVAHRRSKRRKLDHDSDRTTEYQSYKYGYKGQVVPGRLRMEVVSCDGGQIKRDNPMKMYNVENVLKNDKSVYCSESSKCNLLLKHTGEAPFALEKIVIRAPDRGFTSPYVCLFVTRCSTNNTQRPRRTRIRCHVCGGATVGNVHLPAAAPHSFAISLAIA